MQYHFIGTFLILQAPSSPAWFPNYPQGVKFPAPRPPLSNMFPVHRHCQSNTSFSSKQVPSSSHPFLKSQHNIPTNPTTYPSHLTTTVKQITPHTQHLQTLTASAPTPRSKDSALINGTSPSVSVSSRKIYLS